LQSAIDLAERPPGWHNLPPRGLEHASIETSDPMLRILASWAGRRTAGFVALAYFAGVVMPSVALAFADGAVSAYCFDEIAEQVATLQIHVHVHVHSDGTVHHHVDTTSAAAIHGESQKDQGGTGSQGQPQGHSQSHDHDGNCCGLFGFTAVLPALSGSIAEPAAYHIQQPILTNCLVGCGPDRIDRPPIALLPM
jgi:hypothetical protein